jgi:TonB family protein
MNTDNDNEVKDRSLLYWGLGLGLIVLVMGYVTFFVDDLSRLFGKEDTVETITENRSELLDQSADMSDDEVRRSLIKFIEAFYFDQRRGYFDPPSYFSPLTQTYYNYHNLTYKRLREVHNLRRSNMDNFNQTWVVSSLDFNRDGAKIVASYWVKQSYFRPQQRRQESADVKMEMAIDEQGKIYSFKELEVTNFISNRVAPEPDTLFVDTVGGAIVPSPATAPDASSTRIYNLAAVESPPEFPGGVTALNKYISSELKYPQEARDRGLQGRVIINFIVEKDGDLNGLMIMRSIGGGCDEEALRVLSVSPAWKPGSVGGQAVRTYYTLPITFQLSR